MLLILPLSESHQSTAGIRSRQPSLLPTSAHKPRVAGREEAKKNDKAAIYFDHAFIFA
jgi:hypothetical protein